MIAIPNMEKPKSCAECFRILKCKSVPRWVTADDSIPKGCPLIEIDLVRCGECKYLEVINKAPIYAHCHKWDYDFELWQKDTRKSFCSYGERRADDHI